MLSFPCWGCGKTLKAKEEHAGKKAKCTGCNRLNSIPGVQVVSTPTTPTTTSSSDDNLPVAPVDPADQDDDDRDATILAKRKSQSMQTSDLYADVDSGALESAWVGMGRAFLIVLLPVCVWGMLSNMTSNTRDANLPDIASRASWLNFFGYLSVVTVGLMILMKKR